MATHLSINLIWVPGHRNIEGNCIADELARQGTAAGILRDKDTVGMPMSTCKLHLSGIYFLYREYARASKCVRVCRQVASPSSMANLHHGLRGI